MDENSKPTTPIALTPSTPESKKSSSPNVAIEVANRMIEAQNVLVALSSDPSVDEMAAAIGLTLCLDAMGKRVAAIYSGATPNALEFLKPEDTFEPTADTLQDFVIALNKEKADHLRYKLDGDYVKIYITPYRAKITENDLEFTYGDYNVDLVLALDVANGADLDSALREHGRIMHDASVVNITTGNPGKFGEIEWSDKKASSVSEMIARLLYSMGNNVKLDKDEATAFLTGIVAATNRFSNAKTTPATMQIASKLMASGANQQLVSKNITPDVENELYAAGVKAVAQGGGDPTKLDIKHEEVVEEAPAEDNASAKEVASNAGAANEASAAPVPEETYFDAAALNTESAPAQPEEQPSALMEDLKAAEASLAMAGNEAVPEAVEQPVKIESNGEPTAVVESELNSSLGGMSASDVSAAETNSGFLTGEPVLPQVMAPGGEAGEGAGMAEGVTPGANEPEGLVSKEYAEKVIQPPAGSDMAAMPSDGSEKYGKMLEDALGGAGGAMAGANPASMMAPQVASAPEINGVPEMNYMPLPGQEILPPPPTPPINMDNSVNGATGAMAPGMPSTPSMPVSAPAPAAPAMPIISSGDQPAEPTSLGPQPAMQDQIYAPQAVDPGAFKIPGM